MPDMLSTMPCIILSKTLIHPYKDAGSITATAVCFWHFVLVHSLSYTAGVVSELGSCCPVNSTAGANVTLDRAGNCCSRGLDVCGVCGGDGMVVDFTGNCCNGALDASGLCCAQPHVVDDFGVCAGNSSTGVIVLDLNVLSAAVAGEHCILLQSSLLLDGLSTYMRRQQICFSPVFLA